MNKGYDQTKEKGTILVIVLFIVALLEIIALSYLTNQKLSIRSVENLTLATTFKYELDSIENQVKSNLLLALKENPGEDRYDLVLAEAFDVQNKINLNSFVKTENQEILYPALKKIALMPEYGFEGDIESLIKKIQGYLNLYTPYYETNPTILPFSHINDIDDMNLSKIEISFLKKVFVVLPTLVPLNVNTMTPESMLSLSDELTYPEAESLISLRDSRKPFNDVSTFASLEEVEKLNLEIDYLTVTSQFYVLDYTIEYKRLKYHLQSLAEVITDENNSKVVIRWRQFG